MVDGSIDKRDGPGPNFTNHAVRGQRTLELFVAKYRDRASRKAKAGPTVAIRYRRNPSKIHERTEPRPDGHRVDLGRRAQAASGGAGGRRREAHRGEKTKRRRKKTEEGA